MIVVRIDRESLSLSEDVDSHAVAWTFDDSARLGDVVLRILAERYLPTNSGRVVWTVHLHAGTADTATVLPAIVQQGVLGSARVVPLTPWLLAEPLLSLERWRQPDGAYEVGLGYVSDGAPRDARAFEHWLDGRRRPPP